MRIVAVLVVVIAAGCWSKPTPTEPVANTAPVQQPPAKKPVDDCAYRSSDGDPSMDYAMSSVCRYTRRICACTDMDCITKAGQEYAAQMEQWAKDNAGKMSKPSDADRAWLEKITKELTECTTRIATDAAKNAGATGSASP
jgi:hypothetical protein